MSKHSSVQHSSKQCLQMTLYVCTYLSEEGEKVLFWQCERSGAEDTPATVAGPGHGNQQAQGWLLDLTRHLPQEVTK